MKKENEKIVPIFFATDDNYVPYLAVALKSLLANASKEYFYKVYVITTQLTEDNMRRLLLLKDEKSTIEFVSLKNELDKISNLFRLRDYYSKETYYRFFIPSLFPEYEKVIYLDCDMVVLEDISKLYQIDLGDNYLAASQEEVLLMTPALYRYPVECLGIRTEDYFSAGMMLINSKKFLKDKIAEQFVALAKRFTFRLIQDEDYLNVLCGKKHIQLDLGWNKSAGKIAPYFDDKDLKIIHYKINWKPWHYEGVLYEEYFWKYAKETDFYLDLQDQLKTYPEERKIIDQNGVDNFTKIILEDIADPNNYNNVVVKPNANKKNLVNKIVTNNALNKITNMIGLKGYRSVYGSRKK